MSRTNQLMLWHWRELQLYDASFYLLLSFPSCWIVYNILPLSSIYGSSTWWRSNWGKLKMHNDFNWCKIPLLWQCWTLQAVKGSVGLSIHWIVRVLTQNMKLSFARTSIIWKYEIYLYIACWESKLSLSLKSDFLSKKR